MKRNLKQSVTASVSALKTDCNAKVMSAASLHDRWKRNKLNLNPEFQRDEAWTTSQKQLLIDSLLRKFDLPKFYFREQANDAYDVVDGQQRSRAICEYFDNSFALPRKAEPVGEHEVKGKKFDGLPDDLRDRLRDAQLTCMILQNYSDELIDELFLRLQNGTPLNPAEKRKAIGGNVRNIVAEIAAHNVFTKGLCAYTGARSQYLDTAAKLLYQQYRVADGMVDIRNSSLEDFYRNNAEMSDTHVSVVRTKRALDFIYKALNKSSVDRLRKYMVLTLVYLIAKMQSEYDLSGREKDVCKTLHSFLLKKAENDAEEDESKKDRAFTAFHENARNDSKEAMEERLAFLEQYFLSSMPDLASRDSARRFTNAQRTLIWLRNGSPHCKKCSKSVTQDTFHADHIKSWKSGGKTSVDNGQVLCEQCNLKKGAS